jgi:hypothetical protein
MFLAATLVHAGGSSPVKVRNMSERGAMVEASVLPDVGDITMLLRGSLRVEAHVTWRRSNQCGLTFASAVDVASWLAPAVNSGQSRVDQDIAAIRAGLASAPTSPPPAVSPNGSRPRDAVVVDNLSMIISLLADLEEDLIGNPSTVAAHGVKLQNIDLATQVLDVLADVMSNDLEKQQAGLARLNDLQVSCQHALIPSGILGLADSDP